MIKKTGNLFILETNNTSYIIRIMPTGHLEHLYYGKKIQIEDLDCLNTELCLCEKNEFPCGNLISYSEEEQSLTLEDRCLELSSYGKGDLREAFIKVVHEDGSKTSDFLYHSYEILQKKEKLSLLPSAYDEEDGVTQLNIILKDQEGCADDELVLKYCVFEDCDVITKSSLYMNHAKNPVRLEKLMSNQLDFDEGDYDFIHFNGAWAREMDMQRNHCMQGKMVQSSLTGTSSSRSNPFVMISLKETTNNAHDCYGFNLIYSGNHYEVCEKNSFGKMRFVSGINPEDFCFYIGEGESFQSPEAVISYSDAGFEKLSHQMHAFVRNHIVRGKWKFKERPVLINSWESVYFDFNEQELLKMAKIAKDIGIELFVLDDGWFGKRDNDTCSLGDWNENLKKLPQGLKRLSEKINDMGLLFGIWVEPEMVNEDSDCYRLHPNWAIQIPNRKHAKGRHQMILNLTMKEVREYIIESMRNVFKSAKISYVKWDMNRIFSDVYGENLKKERQGEFFHRYVLGLYEILDILVNEFPDILFEGCSAGGNRFDLGMLCYMPQIWASDNTDAICRAKIQNGYSYGYPMSVISAHVSGCPNHQTLRNTSIETRFNVACFGVLGYECRLTDLNSQDLKAIKEQIALYKEYRKTLQYGTFYRLKLERNDSSNSITYQWMSVSDDKKQAIAMMIQTLVTPNAPYAKLVTRGLDENIRYCFQNRELKYNILAFGDLINMVSPIHIKQDSILHHTVSKFIKMDGEKEEYYAFGSLLNHAGIKLKPGFCATGYNENIRYYQDFSSRLYLINSVEKEKIKTEEHYETGY